LSISIYYAAVRSQSLTINEQSAIETIEARYQIEALIAKCGITNSEFDGEAFCIYEPNNETGLEVIFEGSTKLPLYSLETTWVAIEYWCKLLSEVRQLLPNTTWRVHVDDREIVWVQELKMFDPSL
jgi:hypothetical protein